MAEVVMRVRVAGMRAESKQKLMLQDEESEESRSNIDDLHKNKLFST